MQDLRTISANWRPWVENWCASRNLNSAIVANYKYKLGQEVEWALKFPANEDLRAAIENRLAKSQGMLDTGGMALLARFDKIPAIRMDFWKWMLGLE